MQEGERRHGWGRRSTDDVHSRLMLLEVDHARQFTSGQSLHAQDHDDLRQAVVARRQMVIHVSEKVVWALIAAVVGLLIVGIKSWTGH